MLLNNSSATVVLKDAPEEAQNLELCFVFGLLSCVIMTHSRPNCVGVYDSLSAVSSEGAVCVFVIKLP